MQGSHVRSAKEEMHWPSFIVLLHLSIKGFALNECGRCVCCKGGASRCTYYNAVVEHCGEGCIDGYFGIRCENACMNNCLICLYAESCNYCSSGYYGADCIKCPDNCLTCSDRNSCIICTDGFYSVRLYDRADNSYYSDCRYKCQNNCKSCTSYATCTECIEGKYNGIYSDCRESCNSTCKTCSSYSKCTACPVGKYGSSCLNNCGLGCQNNLCDFNNGSCTCITNFQGDKCDQCVNGKYGSSCNSDCPYGCAGNYCKISGGCYSCKSDHGFYQPYCQECPEQCEDCTSKTHCSDCKSGHWGETCQLSCPPNCIGPTCRKLSGDCNLPCALGYWGTKCNFTCPTNCKGGNCNSTTGMCNDGCRRNYYGEHCNMTCATTCLPDDEERRCLYTNGSCVKDCQIGYYGDMCQNRCSENCINMICLRVSGTCKLGCIGGYGGNDCTKSKSGVISNSGKTADTSNVGLITGVGVGSVAATLLAVVIVIIIRRYLRQEHLRRYEQERILELTDVQQENVRTINEPACRQPTTDSGYVNTAFSIYEQLKESNKDTDTYDRIGGTVNVS